MFQTRRTASQAQAPGTGLHEIIRQGTVKYFSEVEVAWYRLKLRINPGTSVGERFADVVLRSDWYRNSLSVWVNQCHGTLIQPEVACAGTCNFSRKTRKPGHDL